MLVTEGAVETARHLEHRHINRGVDITRSIAPDLRVPAGVQERRQEGVLGLEAHQDDHVSAIEQHGKLGLHRHGVDVFHAGGDASDVGEVPGDLPGHVGQVGDGRHDLDLLCGAGVRREQRDDREQNEEEASHGHLLTVAEAVGVAAHDDRPLKEELIVGLLR